MKKKKIALIVDEENWAFHHIALQISTKLAHKYDFKIIFRKYVENMVSVICMVQDYDLIHFFWRGDLYLINQDYVKYYLLDCGLTTDYFIKKYYNNLLITTSVYDHLFLSESEIEITNSILQNCFAYTVSSEKLLNIYKQDNIIKKPDAKITDGVDLENFYPINLKRLKNKKNGSLIMGWVGNSEWSKEKGDMKGVNTILKPAIKELQNKGYYIVENFADKKIRMIPHDKMCEYYSEIDILVCSSEIEGTPNPILEAMACGVPVISTNVGIVPEVFGKLQKKFILEERSIQCLKEKIIEIINNPKLLIELSNENLKSIKKWDWKYKIKEFDDFFVSCMEKRGHNENKGKSQK